MATSSKFAWVNEYRQSSEVSIVKPARSYHTRREHKKSKNGCKNCRQRRIKCDEVRPECGQCLHRQVGCHFQSGLAEKHNPLASNRQRSDSASRESINQILLHLEEEEEEEEEEEAGVPESDTFKNIISNRAAARELLDHFVNTTTNWLGSPDFQRIIQKQGLLLAIKAPYVIHAILAISACHLSRLKPHEKYNVAAAIRYQHTLKTYSFQLGVPINSDNVDEIIGCGFLHTMLAFENVSRLLGHEKISKSGPEPPASATWLRAMQGMGILQRTQDIRSRCKKSIWIPVFRESGGCEEVSCQHAVEAGDRGVAAAISRSLHALCEVPLELSGHGNVYHQPLKLLCGLMRVNASHETIGRFIVFIGELPPGFVQLFEQNDIKAMLIMAYWCALMIGIDQWWIVDSAISECRRLCAILDIVSISAVRELLHFPARRCRYVLREYHVGT